VTVSMKAAVAYEDGEVFQHFGETPAFRIYEAEGYDIVSAETVDCDGRSHMELVDFLKDLKVDALICGGICEEPWTELTRSGIKCGFATSS